jgi:hypothetical protein
MGRPKRAEQVLIAERRTKMVEMRRDGHSFQEIADALGYASRHAASKDFCRTLERNIAKQHASMEVLRELEIHRLDGELERLTRLYAKVEKILDRFHVTVQFGKVVDLDGEPIEDDGPALAAVDRLVKIEDARRRNGERRAKLLGLEAAQKVEVLTLDALDAEAARLNALLAAGDSQAAAHPGDTGTPR